MTTFYNYSTVEQNVPWPMSVGETEDIRSVTVADLFNDNIGQHFACILYRVHRAVHVRFCMYVYVC
jgi:hypothetical protein